MNYRNAISDFQKYLKYIYSDKNSFGTEYRGYLINLKDYERIKKIIYNNKVNINDSENNFKINQIEFKTPQYLINMILNENKYIFINTDLWELICDKDKRNESPIIYQVNRNDITFTLDNIEFSFIHNKNIINKYILKNSSNYQSNYEEIKKILDSTIYYYNFEKKILNYLKNKQDSNDSSNVYLVSKNWINKWKIFSDYENIKYNYLQNNLNNKEDILNDLIYYVENNKINNSELFKSINIMKFGNKEEIESFLKNELLVLVDSKFLNCFNCDFSENSLKYKVFNNKINVYLDNNEILSFNSNNNIISLNGIINYSNRNNNKVNKISNIKKINHNNFNDYNNPYLSKAIKLYFYYQEFSKKIKETKNDEKEYYLINNNLISEIKINYKYNQIKEELDEINFMDNDNNKKLAIKSLSNDIIKYFTDNKEIEDKFEKDYMEPDIIPINGIKEKESYMIYYKFEILEREMAQDLINNINKIYPKENNYLKCEINEGKIIIHYPQNFNGNDKFISVIGQLNNENHFLNEYILIYNDSSSRLGHMHNIKRNLNNYLTSLQLYKNSAPIIDENYKEIGTIIKYCNEAFNYDSNNLRININEINNNSSKWEFNNNPKYSLEKNENDLNKNIPYNKSNNPEDEYNLDYQTDSHEIKANFISPPKIGLQNIGTICYMNTILQCFCHIEKFVNYFKYSQQVISLVRNNKNNLTSSFKLLIEKLWPNNYNESYPQKYYAPEEFKNKISKINPLFEGIASKDAKDLVNFIIMTLHQELNKAKKSNNNINLFLDPRNQQIMFNNFAQKFILENKSIISDLFYGINCNITQCNSCQTNLYNYQIYFFIEFPLEEISKFKNNMFFNNPVTIYDCFDYDRKVNLMYGENSMYCNYCKQNSNFKMCTCLTTGPEILIILFDRGKGIEFNMKIYFMEDLDLSNYIQFNNTGDKYKLIGVITHNGESGMGGNFIAYCKDPISQSWTKYNDAIASEVQDQDFQRKVINFAMPYLLFYQKSS